MNERGITLPIALIALSILSSLMIALATISKSEPTIASNHMMSARARSFAESGVERAIWAVNNPAASGLNLAAVSAPYDGSASMAVDESGGATLGSYQLTIQPDAVDPNLIHITSVGSAFVPSDASPFATKRITVDAIRLKFGGPEGTPPCAICMGGETPPGEQSSLQVGGNATVNANNTTGSDPLATYCEGQTPTAAIISSGTVSTNGNPAITAPPGGTAITQGISPSTFTPFTLTNADFTVLKAIAKARGTYYQGGQQWTSPPANGLIVVDTPSGEPLTATSPSSDLFTVDLHGNWATGWSGWMIIAGSVDISGNMNLTGVIYAQNDFKYNGTGGGRINGALVAQNRVDSVASQADATDKGNGVIIYSCPAIQDGGGSVSDNWLIKPGTYKEVAGT